MIHLVKNSGKGKAVIEGIKKSSKDYVLIQDADLEYDPKDILVFLEENKKFRLVSSKKTRYLLPNILTLAGVCLGISSIKFSIDGNFSLAVTLILIAAILDALDGRIARLIKGTSEVGKELDSLADVISFGVAPAFIMYFWKLNELGRFGWLLCLIYVSCVALPLPFFTMVGLTRV